MTPSPAKSAPQRIVLDGLYCRLEPVSQNHAEDLFAASVAERYRWLFVDAPADLDAMKARIADEEVDLNTLYFAVIDKATGRCEGQQAFMNIAPGNGSVEIGGVYWGPAIARSRVATEALFLFAQYAFDDLGYRRFEWKCNDRNAPSKAAAQRFGFSHEGTFRQHMIIKGESRDTAWFSIIDGEWPERRAAFEAWLSPDNFDAHGQQLARLDTKTYPAPDGAGYSLQIALRRAVLTRDRRGEMEEAGSPAFGLGAGPLT